MSNETQTPTAAKLRHVATTIAQDIGNAPVKSPNHMALLQLNMDLQMYEKTMSSTSEAITSSILHTQDLVMEAHRWSSAGVNGKSMIKMIDQSLNTILGFNNLYSTNSTQTKTTTTTTGHSASSSSSHVNTKLKGELEKNNDRDDEAAIVVSSDMAHP